MDKVQKPRRLTGEANRRRAVRACDGCRRVKERCEGGIPCRRCTHLKRQCEFTAAAAARFPPLDSIHGVLASSGPVAGHADASGGVPPMGATTAADEQQRVANMERLLVHFVGNISMDAQTLQQLADSLDDEVAGKQDRRGPRSKDGETAGESDSNGSDRVEMDDITVQPLENNVTHYSGEFSHWNFSMRIKNWIEKSGPYRTDSPDAPKIREFYRVEELQSPSDTSQLLSSCPPRFVADFLVGVFFRYAEGNYFYVDRTWLNRKMDLIYDAPTSLTRRDVPALGVLFMVLAIGTQYAYLESDAWKTGGDGSSMPSSVANSNNFSEDNVGIMLYQQACRLLPDVITIASLESVQACLLIGLYTLPLDPSGLSWVYLNLAMKLAIQNGMHRRYPGQASDPAMIETRSRVWWTLYMMEKRVGTFHGRPTSIASNEVDADWPSDRHDIWPGSPPRNTPQLMASLQLSQFLGRIAHEISCFKTHNKQTTLYALARLSKAKDDLHQWWHSLPEEVSFARSLPHTSPRASFHLRLEFCMVRMYAGRLFITPRRGSEGSRHASIKSPSRPRSENFDSPPTSSTIATTNTSSGSNSGAQPHLNVLSAHSSSQRRSSLVSDCVDAAITVVDICRTLQGGIGLARASYTEFSTLRIALLVILSQFLAKKQQSQSRQYYNDTSSTGSGRTATTATESLRQPLCDGIAMLKSMSTWGASARFDASLIEAFEHTIARMETGDLTGDFPGDAQQQQQRRPGESNYEMFKRWESMWQGGAAVASGDSASSTRGDGPPPTSADPLMDMARALPPPLGDPMGGTGGWDHDAVRRMDSESTTAGGPETGSSFGIDWNFSSMPMLEGLSAMLEQGYGFGTDMET